MNCLCAKARRGARSLTRLYEQHLQPFQLTPAQLELLGHISARPGIAQAALVQQLSVDQTTLSRNLRVLAGRKWVRRTASASDHRQSAYTLTPSGQEILHAALPAWERAQQHMRRALGADWQAALSLLDRLHQAAA